MEGYLDCQKHKFKYDELKGQVPLAVNPLIRELYLTQEEFQSIFKMSITEYQELKEWKKLKLKKALQLIY